MVETRSRTARDLSRKCPPKNRSRTLPLSKLLKGTVGSCSANENVRSPRAAKRRRQADSTLVPADVTLVASLPRLEENYQKYAKQYEDCLDLENEFLENAADIDGEAEEKFTRQIQKIRLKKLKWRDELLSFCQDHSVQSKVLEDQEGLTIYQFNGTTSAHLNRLVTEVVNARLLPDVELLRRMILEAKSKERWNETPDGVHQLDFSADHLSHTQDSGWADQPKNGSYRQGQQTDSCSNNIFSASTLMVKIHEEVLKVRKAPKRSFLMNAMAELARDGQEVSIELQELYETTPKHSRRRWDEAFKRLGRADDNCTQEPVRVSNNLIKRISLTGGQLTTLSGEPAWGISPATVAPPRRIALTSLSSSDTNSISMNFIVRPDAQASPEIPVPEEPTPTSLDSTAIQSPSPRSGDLSSSSATTLPGSPAADIPAVKDYGLLDDGCNEQLPLLSAEDLRQDDCRSDDPSPETPLLPEQDECDGSGFTMQPVSETRPPVLIYQSELKLKCTLLDMSYLTKARGKVRLPKT